MRAAVAFCLLLALPLSSAAQALYEGFEGSFPPPDWFIADGAGGGAVFQNNGAWSHANWTGGGGLCVELCTDGDPTDYDAWLRTPPFVVPPGGHLYARVNYQNFSNEDRFEVYMVVALNNYLLASYQNDIGGFYDLPGEWIDIDLSHLESMELQIAFRYHDPVGDPGDDWYCQIDDVTVGDDSAARKTSWSAIKSLYR